MKIIKYDMSKDFQDKAISCIEHICNQLNVFNKRIPNSPIVSFWNIDDDGRRLYDCPEFKDYLTFVKPHIQDYLKELELPVDEAMVTAMWGVHYKTGQYVRRHQHTYNDYKKSPHKFTTPYDVFAVLLYLNKPEHSGNLFVETSDGIQKEIDLKDGDVIMFPSMQYHWTSPNKSQESKYVVGIEIIMKWSTDDELIGKPLGEL